MTEPRDPGTPTSGLRLCDPKRHAWGWISPGFPTVGVRCGWCGFEVRFKEPDATDIAAAQKWAKEHGYAD